MRDLGLEAHGFGIFELVGPVRGEAVACAPHEPRQHDDGGRIGREMRMDMVDALRPRALAQEARLHQVGDRPNEAAGVAAKPQPGGKAFSQTDRIPGDLPEKCRHQAGDVSAEQVLGRTSLGLVAWIHQRDGPSADREASDLKP